MLPEWDKPSFVISVIWALLMDSPDRHSARMSKITKDGLTRSGTAVPMWQQWPNNRWEDERYVGDLLTFLVVTVTIQSMSADMCHESTTAMSASTTSARWPIYTKHNRPSPQSRLTAYKVIHSSHSHDTLVDWLIDWAGFNVCTNTVYRLYGRRFLQVKRPNQQYQSTEGTQLTEKIQ